jgi:hypothetical protein
MEQPQQDKGRKGTLKERFIKNMRPLNLTNISSQKEKQLKTRIIRRVVMMSYFDDDEEREILLKR